MAGQPGTGPGRGVPWWRQAFLWTNTGQPGQWGPEGGGGKREGRTVAKIKSKGS